MPPPLPAKEQETRQKFLQAKNQNHLPMELAAAAAAAAAVAIEEATLCLNDNGRNGGEKAAAAIGKFTADRDDDDDDDDEVHVSRVVVESTCSTERRIRILCEPPPVLVALVLLHEVDLALVRVAIALFIATVPIEIYLEEFNSERWGDGDGRGGWADG